MMNEFNLKNITEYLKKHRQCVIGTCANNVPFVAKVYCYLIGDFELIFSTFPNSNKFKNLISNPDIAIEMDDGSPGNCMHYQGKAKLIESKAEADNFKEYIISQDAPFRKFMEKPDLQFFIIKPSVIYYTDYQKKLFHRDIIKFDKDMNIVEIRNEKIF